MGAWIEIYHWAVDDVQAIVAPHMGAWIEIVVYFPHLRCSNVAPHMGAWIEIIMKAQYGQLDKGRTPHGCVD